MKRKIIKIMMLIILILLVSKINVQATLVDALNKNSYKVFLENINKNFNDYGLHATKTGSDKKTVNVKVTYGGDNTLGEGDLFWSTLTRKTTITITPQSGDQFYSGDHINLVYTIAQYKTSNFYDVIQDFEVKTKGYDNISKNSCTIKHLKINTSQEARVTKIPQNIILKEGKNEISVYGEMQTWSSEIFGNKLDLHTVKDEIKIVIPNVKNNSEHNKDLQESGEDRMSGLILGKDLKKIVSPHLKIESGKVNAIKSARNQIIADFPEISISDAEAQLQFVKDESGELVKSDDSKVNLEVYVCKATYVIKADRSKHPRYWKC